ncbi:hypothetical protein PI124_g13468 [Phytophthora idaei]|nr:hypothetical protein PI125_g20903 [Phytophthora idaei]KAG3241667.1 hypothetical protein PI124_g13468 [Phytophthora idaei]
MNAISVSPQAMSNADWCLVAAISFMSYASFENLVTEGRVHPTP